nr:cysteine-rich receptor-like protein kinase 2 [Ipomoea batatas]
MPFENAQRTNGVANRYKRPVSSSEPAFSDPQTQIVDQGCGLYHVTDVPDYNRELNLSFADLRNQLSSANKRFATSTQKTVYAMAQCRKYLSTADCVSCFDAAVIVTRNCSIAGVSSAIVILDGCFLRYNNGYFYDQSIDEIIGGTYRVCGNRTASKQHIFNATAAQLLNQLLLATPRIHGFYAAAKLQEESPGGATTYAVAQCAETMSESNCKDCLSVAYNNIKDCLPNSEADGRAGGLDAEMFLEIFRHPFFWLITRQLNIAPFLGTGHPTKRGCGGSKETDNNFLVEQKANSRLK